MAIRKAQVIPIGAHQDTARHLDDLEVELQLILQAVNVATTVEEVRETVARLVRDSEWTVFKLRQLVQR